MPLQNPLWNLCQHHRTHHQYNSVYSSVFMVMSIITWKKFAKSYSDPFLIDVKFICVLFNLTFPHCVKVAKPIETSYDLNILCTTKKQSISFSNRTSIHFLINAYFFFPYMKYWSTLEL